MSNTSFHSNANRDTFDGLYDRLSTTWESHQQLKSKTDSIQELGASSIELDKARSAMWEWWAMNKRSGVR